MPGRPVAGRPTRCYAITRGCPGPRRTPRADTAPIRSGAVADEPPGHPGYLARPGWLTCANCPASVSGGAPPMGPARVHDVLANERSLPDDRKRRLRRHVAMSVAVVVTVVIGAGWFVSSRGSTASATAGSLPWPADGQSTVEVEGMGGLGTKGRQEPVPIASVAKVMTAYVILQEHPLKGSRPGPVIDVDRRAVDESRSAEESTVSVSEGQRLTERQSLELMLIPSGNNIARLLARWNAGTEETFVAKMNRAAAVLGMTRTTY